MANDLTPDDLLKNAFWLTDLLIGELEKLHAEASCLEGVAKGEIRFTAQDARLVLERVEHIAFGIGTIKSAIGEFGAFIPEAGE